MTSASKSDFDWRGTASLERFKVLNQERLQRVLGTLTARQQDFLHALPLIFHANHPMLPGYIGKDTPFGIAKYAPTQATTKAVRRLYRAYEPDRRMAPRFAVRGLYIMGSPGTIAYSRGSDLDMWLMHDPDLQPEAVALLAEKASRVEKFAATLGLEVHFFVFDADRFRRGEDLSLSDESSGSSQHYLLLDEFYRSSLLVAGLPPLWWSVPSEYDKDYDNYVSAAEQRGLIDRWDAIDFGGLPTIPSDEFFGAAVWQLYKSIHAPYKSVLKLLLMEAYSDEYPDITLLSTCFKRNVEAGTSDLNELDPYILMYEKVQQYLLSANDSVRLEVLRRSFYLKTNIALSDSRRTTDDWRTQAVTALLADWGWSSNEIERLDQRADWGLDTAVEERHDLTRTFRESYAKLSKFAKAHASDSKISKQDLHVLGRKLYVAFEKKPSKIEVVTQGICSDPVEQRLSLHEVTLDSGKIVWLLFTGTVTPAQSQMRQPIKRSGSAAELVLWCYLNKLSDKTTTWHVFPTVSELNAADIKRINDALAQNLGLHDQNQSNDDANDRRRIARIALLVNVGINPFSKSVAGGDVLTSNAGDPLAYGGRAINLIRTIDLMFMTSWDEAFAFRFEGPRAILEAIAECIQWTVNERAQFVLPTIETRCFNQDCAAQISMRVDSMFRETLALLTRSAAAKSPAFVMQAEESLHHLKVVQGQPKLESHPKQVSLFKALGDISEPAAQRQEVTFDPGCQRAGCLPTIFAAQRDRVIQIFAQARGQHADVFIIDERGYLLVNRQECHTMRSLLQHYRRFLTSTLPRCVEDPTVADSISIETYEIISDNDSYTLKPQLSEVDDVQHYLPLNVLADADSNGHQQFTIYTSDREFSTWEHGGSLFSQVAAFVLAQRRGSDFYPIYITDLDLSTRFRQSVGVNALRPIDLLNYKKRIEFQLTRAMRSGDTTARVEFQEAS